MSKLLNRQLILNSLTVLFVFLVVYLIYRLNSLLVLLFISFLFVTAVNPFVNKLETFRLPRPLSIAIVYLITLGLLTLGISIILPPFRAQVELLIDQINLPPAIIQQFYQYNLTNIPVLITQWGSLSKVFNLVTWTSSSMVFFISFLMISFYLLMDRPRLHYYLTKILGNNLTEDKAEHFVNVLEKEIGGWIRGQVTVMTLFGLLIFIGLTLMQIPYALPLAFLAIVCELIPNIGGLISAIPAIIYSWFNLSPAMAIAIAAFYFLSQQFEHSVIIPSVMKRVIDLKPIITILVIMVGFELRGVGGALLAIPIYLTLKVFFTEWHKIKQPEKT